MFSIFQWIAATYTTAAVAYILAVIEAENNPVEDE